MGKLTVDAMFDGVPLAYPPSIWHIELSEDLADTKIMAEAWDAAGLYQIGYFPGYRWGEWNGRYRDDVRRFLRGDGGLIGEPISGAASAVSGSSWSCCFLWSFFRRGARGVQSICAYWAWPCFSITTTTSACRRLPFATKRGPRS